MSESSQTLFIPNEKNSVDTSWTYTNKGFTYELFPCWHYFKFARLSCFNNWRYSCLMTKHMHRTLTNSNVNCKHWRIYFFNFKWSNETIWVPSEHCAFGLSFYFFSPEAGYWGLLILWRRPLLYKVPFAENAILSILVNLIKKLILLDV